MRLDFEGLKSVTEFVASRYDACLSPSNRVAAYLKVPVEFTNTRGMKFRLIPPGEFLMGYDQKEIDRIKPKIFEGFRGGWEEAFSSATPRHAVRITRPFYIQTHEVNVRQYEGVMGSLPDDNDPAQPECAVMKNVSLVDAVAFCDELSRKENKTPAHRMESGVPSRILDANGYRMPTEAEWEFACRAGTTTLWFIGDDDAIAANSDVVREYQSFYHGSAAKPNPFGLVEMYGGSTEWCFDRLQPYQAAAVTDPFAEPGTYEAVCRGGNFFSGGGADPRVVNSVMRMPGSVTAKNPYVGLGRVVLPIEMPKTAPSGPARAAANAPPPAIAPFNAKQAIAHQTTWAKHLGVPVPAVNSVGAKMMLIPPGDFLMGSTDEQVAAAMQAAAATGADQLVKELIQKNERPQHRVVIAQPFLMGATEVTIGQFQKFVDATKYLTEAEQFKIGDTSATTVNMDAADAKASLTWRAPGHAVTEDCPVAQITWNDATAYCKWLSNQEKVTYRLPTEAEWEFACRAGTTTQFAFGDDESRLDEHAWTAKNSGYISHPVGTKLPNAFGLFDMHGNLSEWCLDPYEANAYSNNGEPKVTDPETAGMFSIRSGHWFFDAPFCRSATRHRSPASLRYRTLGFRILRVVEAP